MKKKILRYGLLAALVGIAAFIAFILSVQWGAFGKIPNEDDLRSIRNYLASEVYSDKGELIGKYFVENRTGATLEEIDSSLIHALVATEDVRFYEHDGVDHRSLLRVLVKSILMGDESSGGGSTITQQLAKNLYGRKSFGILTLPVAKVREYIIAKRLEEVYSKGQILELYLNTVSFGENVYGIETASQRYFNEKPAELSVEQGAVLIGLLKANTLYNPHRNPEAAMQRRNVVLAQMAKYGYLSEREKDSLQEIPLEIDYYNLEEDRPAPYFLAHIKPEVESILKNLSKPDGSAFDIHRDGLVIETTLNKDLQDWANEAVQLHMKRLQSDFDKHWGDRDPWGRNVSVIENEVRKTALYKRLSEQGLEQDSINKIFATPHSVRVFSLSGDEGFENRELSPLDSIKYYQRMLHAGFLAMDPTNGDVKAWVGGLDFQYLPYDHVTSRRQTASTFKPFVYGAALEKGMEPCEFIPNERRVYEEFDDYSPENADKQYGEYYSLKGALKKSLNVVSVEVAMQTGLEKVANFARRMGFTSTLREIPSMALGTNEASLLEMVSAYGAFANGGRRVRPQYITRIKDAFGNTLWERKRTSFEQVTDTTTIRLLTEMLKGVVNEGTGSSIRSTYRLQQEYAGKTGTNQDYSDGWFIGYTPKLVAGAWVGASSPKVHFRGSQGSGSRMALPIWAKFFGRVERSGYRRIYTPSFPALGDSLKSRLDCPDHRDANLFERLDEWIFEGESIYDKAERNQEETYRERRERILREREEKRREMQEKEEPTLWEKIFGKKKR
ncbi:MAG: transglycosylase domain-containing protein [Bacteroidota bacterium]|nr:transglycosylase domain-containing protein [Bacteroidota bacterium]MDX5505425.1 transglycosylase domain-containing protein [Bacteroidota bacterium]